MVCVGVGEIATELRHTVEFFQPLDTRSSHSPLWWSILLTLRDSMAATAPQSFEEDQGASPSSR
jgi:hypothetical protein